MKLRNPGEGFEYDVFMKTTAYRTDITGAEFDPVKSCLQIKRASKWPLIMIVNAIFYVCGEGIKWRALPADFGLPWQTAYWYFRKWTESGAWAAINEALVMIRRQSCGAQALPATLIIDAQSVKNSPTATSTVGTDGGKKIKGRKRMLVVDSAGNLLAVKVFAANRHDGPMALSWWRDELCSTPFFEAVSKIKGDHHFGGKFRAGVERHSEVRVEISAIAVQRPSQSVMPVHKGRWVVERSIAWESNSRRLSKDYERLPQSSEAFCLISAIARLIKHPLSLN